MTRPMANLVEAVLSWFQFALPSILFSHPHHYELVPIGKIESVEIRKEAKYTCKWWE